MSTPPRQPAAYVHGVDGPVVVVPARIAAVLERRAGLADLRLRMRGVDAELDAVLEALLVAALRWRAGVGVGSVHGTTVAEPPAVPAGCVLTTSDAAMALAMTDRGVRKAIADGRLSARWAGDVWLIEREDLEHFRAIRDHEGGRE